MNLLEVQELHHWFGGLHVINDVSFGCPTGIVKGIIGPNGAGKTTLSLPSLTRPFPTRVHTMNPHYPTGPN